jgi:AAA domain
MQSPILFPIDQPVMPEARQVGRLPAIDRLQRMLVSPSHIWLIGERRIGKTSVAKAVLARSRAAGSVALDVDLSRPGIDSPSALAGDIARQAQSGGAGTESTVQKAVKLGRRHRKLAKGADAALEALGFDDAAAALAGVSAILAGADDGAPGLDPILRALAVHAHATGRRVWLLLDEVHHLADLDGTEEAVAHWCHQEQSPLIFLFAGSEESAARELREPDRPLAAIGVEFELDQISHEDWLTGLRSRFAEAQIGIADQELFAIIEASDCHPRRTMLIAGRAADSAIAQPDREADPTVVELAIRAARKDRSWR